MDHNPNTTTYRRPDEMLWRTEPIRALGDLLAFWAALPTLPCTPVRESHPVLVLPGFLADDISTFGLRALLQARGYRASGWGLGTNIGPTQDLWSGAVEALQRLHQTHGERVSLIGQSLGGIFARELARAHPDLVRQVITLGSPYRLTTSDDPRTTAVGHLYHALRGLHSNAFDGPGEEQRTPLAVPATSIYSRADGVVPWQSCIDLDRPNAENIEVGASHIGMGIHPEVVRIVLDRLAQPIGQWAPYARGDSALAS